MTRFLGYAAIGDISIWTAIVIIVGHNEPISIKGIIAAVLIFIGTFSLMCSGWWMNESSKHKDQDDEEAVQ